MGDVINQPPIWKFLGRVSAITGVVCFGLSSTYDMSFGKMGYGGPLVYLFVCSFMWWLMVWGKRIQASEKFMIWGKRIQVSEKFNGVVGAILFVVICSNSVVYKKYVPGKSDAYTITSYGSFALMSVSLSRKLELGFETGVSAFFLKLFAAQLLKIKWFLLPIALVFCSLVIILRHYPESRVIRVGDEKGRASQDMEGVSGQRQSTTSEDRTSQEESSQAVGEVSEKNTSDGDDDQIESSYSFEQRQVPPIMPTSETAQLRRRRPVIEDEIPRAHHGQIRPTSPPPEHPSGGSKMTPAIQDKPDGAEQEEDSTSSLAVGQHVLEMGNVEGIGGPSSLPLEPPIGIKGDELGDALAYEEPHKSTSSLAVPPLRTPFPKNPQREPKHQHPSVSQVIMDKFQRQKISDGGEQEEDFTSPLAAEFSFSSDDVSVHHRSALPQPQRNKRDKLGGHLGHGEPHKSTSSLVAGSSSPSAQHDFSILKHTAQPEQRRGRRRMAPTPKNIPSRLEDTK